MLPETRIATAPPVPGTESTGAVRSPSHGWWPEIAILCAALLFGSTFKLVQRAVEDVTPFAYITGRFFIAGMVLAPFAWHKTRQHPNYPWKKWCGGCVIAGVFLAAGYILQTEGLQYTSAATSAFITGLSTLFVPLMIAVRRRALPPKQVMAGVVIALIGLWALTGAELRLEKGEWLTLGCAVAYALWLLAQQRYVKALGSIPFATGQVMFVALATAPMTAITGVGNVTIFAIGSMIFTAIACAAVAVTLQLWAQRYLGSSRTALWLLTEPVFAGIVSWATGEQMGGAAIGGASMILAGVAISEVGKNEDDDEYPH